MGLPSSLIPDMSVLPVFGELRLGASPASNNHRHWSTAVGCWAALRVMHMQRMQHGLDHAGLCGWLESSAVRTAPFLPCLKPAICILCRRDLRKLPSHKITQVQILRSICASRDLFSPRGSRGQSKCGVPGFGLIVGGTRQIMGILRAAHNECTVALADVFSANPPVNRVMHEI